MKFIPPQMLVLRKIEVLKYESFLHHFMAYNPENGHHALPEQAESTHFLTSFVLISVRMLEH